MDIKTEIEEYNRANGHFGLIRNPDEMKTFAAANPFTLPEADFPPVDYATLPESAGVANWMQVENQASVGSCQGHAKTSAEELAIYRATGSIVQLNRGFSYYTSQKIDGIRGDNGSTISGGCEASRKYGTCLESLAPYTGRYVTQFSQACYDDALTRRLTAFQKLPNYDAVMRWLYYGIGGIVIGINWDNGQEGDANGCVTSYRASGGGHALALLDWSTRFKDTKGRPYIDRFNSWGKNYGYKGRNFILTSVVDEWCATEDVYGYCNLNGAGVYPAKIDWKI